MSKPLHKILFHGVALLPDGTEVRFTSDDDCIVLDGLKLKTVVFTSVLREYDEVQELIDYLKIIKYGLIIK